jgi:tetratricopeptide (TPR) repeat protein
MFLVMIVLPGCGAHRAPTIADQFVRQGTPSIDFGGPAAKPDMSTAAKLRELSAGVGTRSKDTAGDRVETVDPVLKERLRVLQAHPTAGARRDVALAYQRLGVLDAAYRHLSAAIVLDAKDAIAYDLRARIWRAWTMPLLGIPDARRAVALEPRSATAWNTLGLLLEDSGSLSAAVSAYQRAVLLDDQPRTPGAISFARKSLRRT